MKTAASDDNANKDNNNGDNNNKDNNNEDNNKTKAKKRVYYWDVRAVSHSCHVL